MSRNTTATRRRHRSFVLGLAVAVVSVAGCSDSSPSSSNTAAESSTSTSAATTSATNEPAVVASTSSVPSGGSASSGTGEGWTISTTDVSGDDSLWTGERCGTQIVDGTWVLTSESPDDLLGDLSSTITIEANPDGTGTYEFYSGGQSTSGSFVEGRAGGTVLWQLLENGDVEFNLTNTEILTTFLDGVEVDIGGKTLVTYDPMVWVAGTC